MAILALDPGSKRVGVAVSDATLTLARPLPFLDAEPFARLAASLKEIIAREEVAQILIGLPRSMNGTYGEAADKARAFAARVEKVLALPVAFVDERLSTVEASRRLQEAGHDSRAQKSRIDSAAAAILLQAYLDRPAS